MKIFLSSNPFVKNPNLENRLDMRSLCDVGLVHMLLLSVQCKSRSVVLDKSGPGV